ncbi:xanthine dehydrogenase family protein subunit M [Mycobacterium sp. CBMA293]|uniref:FAD binding domain-containing protein n=1 Tax=unclassified Mycolicibacterium TaxID=2636767 RepID=UPI0012DCD03D|nr:MULTISPECIES: xanthine dehydrogenase family protein subunit M [unclassified Mycolicibacterium]MUL45254.1 xanthine dehydrogenase family protein subunit M [Mycolicibacterium sp. CBMA 360]MUL56773.1 xanthine dehydrogenase family protein subunit M [Mycolicibacterium sp. CBMA 335]MUL69812.1 xanthine dehydrogenase family protein subunit M [Mycolicibacterium sp. CBMA 311]MUL91860.1 xanthine dehydrogenase family protein subunit M [Mycolicibacterium sp. CBMA 230]MUM05599.1 molybdopterin dehydrogenas
MKTFDFHRAHDVDDALAAADTTGGSYYAGGTNLLDLMKLGVAQPSSLVDVGRLGLVEIAATDNGGIMIGSGVTNSAIANHHLVRTQYPVLSHAILSGATTQLRNMATAGGNLMQRTRCPYFMDATFPACNKRQPGSGCSALDGFNREHALFGASRSCVAVHPSDMAVALSILEAVVHVRSREGARRIAISDFFRLPGDQPERDNALLPGELIVGVELPPSEYAYHSWYLKVRDRHSYAFALVSVAVGMTIDDGTVTSAAIALGGVAAKPWRLPDAEAALVGNSADAATFGRAAEVAMDGAAALSQNQFKLDLGRHSVLRALHRAHTRR